MGSQNPWNIYAEQLFPVGYGHPLWYPEPSDGHEISIGDVGWLSEGGLRKLFNSMHDAGDEGNVGRPLPLDYKKFSAANVSIRKENKITQHMVCSRSIRSAEAQADVSGGGGGIVPASAGAGFRFQSTSDGGALIMLVPPAHSEDIESKRHIVNYMRDNFESWMELANSSDDRGWGLELKDHDLMFVCGTTKTSQWGVAAFQGNVYRKRDGYVSADFGSSATAQFSISISNQSLPTSHCRHGPIREWNTPTTPMIQYPGHDRPDSAPLKRDQCIFIHYYKMKRRYWLFREPMLAGAGPHQLPPGPHNPGMDSSMADVGSPMYEFEPERLPAQEQMYDPVNVLLDYILQGSEAEVAIASDLDIIAIFQDQEFPQDIPVALTRLSPQIEVDERGVGTVSVSYRFLQKRRSREEDVTEDAATHVQKRTKHSGDNPLDPESDAHFAMDTDFDGTPSNMVGGVPDMPPVFLPSAAAGQDIPLTLPHMAPGDGGNPLAGPVDEDDAMESPRDQERRPEYGGLSSVHDGSVTALAYSADGRYVVSGSEDTSIIIWDARGSTFLHKLPIHPDVGHEETVSALAFSRDNQLLASASHNEDIVLWSVANGRLQKRIHPDSSIHSLAYTPDGLHLVAGAHDGKLYVWDTETYEQQIALEKNKAVITFIIFSPNGRYMATGGTESFCVIWDTANLLGGEPKSVLEGHKGMVCSAAFAPDNRRIITASDDGSSRIWNAETGEELVSLHEHSGPVWTVAFSPDGKRIASGSSDSTVKVCDSFDGSRLLSLDGHDSMINVVEFSPDGRYIASAASDNMVHLWNASDGSLIKKHNEHNDNVTSVMFSSDGTTLASGSHDGTVHIRPLAVE